MDGLGNPSYMQMTNYFFYKPQAGRLLANLRRVISTGVPGVAAANAADASPRPSDCPVLPHRFDEVHAATRLETASPPQQRTDEPLVEANQPDQKPRGNAGVVIHYRIPPDFARKARTFDTTVSSSRWRAARVAQAMCGVMQQFRRRKQRVVGRRRLDRKHVQARPGNSARHSMPRPAPLHPPAAPGRC